MGRNSSKSVSATSSKINTTNKDASNMSNVLTMIRPVSAAFDASDVPVIRTAVDASDLRANNHAFAGAEIDYSLESSVIDLVNFAAPAVSENGGTYIEAPYNPTYSPATPHYVKDAFPVAAAVAPDLLAPYAGKLVTLAFHVGYDPATGNVIEMGFDTVAGENAKAIATAAANKHKLPVIIKCAETGTPIFTQVKDGTSNRVARVTSAATVRVVKGASAEEIAAQQEAARVKAEQIAEAARVKAEEAARVAQAKADKAAATARAKQIAETAKALAIALKATRTAPDAGTDNYAIFESLKKPEGATCKELNFEHDERNGNAYGTSNRGWKQIAQKLSETCNHDLYQSVRVCNRTTSVNIVLTPAFKLVSKGEEGGAGWYNITPAK